MALGRSESPPTRIGNPDPIVRGGERGGDVAPMCKVIRKDYGRNFPFLGRRGRF